MVGTLHPRRLARQKARKALDKAGVTGYNKRKRGTNGIYTPSYFSRVWKPIAKGEKRLG